MKNRLTTSPVDSKVNVAKGFAYWRENLADIEEYFKDRLKVIGVTNKNVDDTAETLSDLV